MQRIEKEKDSYNEYVMQYVLSKRKKIKILEKLKMEEKII